MGLFKDIVRVIKAAAIEGERRAADPNLKIEARLRRLNAELDSFEHGEFVNVSKMKREVDPHDMFPDKLNDEYKWIPDTSPEALNRIREIKEEIREIQGISEPEIKSNVFSLDEERRWRKLEETLDIDIEFMRAYKRFCKDED